MKGAERVAENVKNRCEADLIRIRRAVTPLLIGKTHCRVNNPVQDGWVNEGWLIDRETQLRHHLSGVTIIGRSADCGIAIFDPAVSRRHAMIRQQADGFWFFDLGSFNGSYVNGRRVVASQRLNAGDHLSISEHDLDFQEQGGSERAQADLLGASTMAQVRTSNAILLVTDVRGFTTLSEKLEPDVLAPIIGSWYSFT